MKAAFHTGKMKMEIHDIPMPEPGDEEYLVKVEACAVCGSDVWWSKDALENEPVHGHETVGIIARTGAGAYKFKEGERVVCAAVLGCGTCPDCAAGRTASCRRHNYIQHGFQEYGTYNVIATTTFDGRFFPWIAGQKMPVVWTKTYGGGKVFYSSLGHSFSDFEKYPQITEITLRGFLWALGEYDTVEQ